MLDELFFHFSSTLFQVKNLLDLTLTADKRRIGIHLEHLLGKRTVGTGVRRCAHDDGQVEELADLGVGEDVLLVQSSVPVAGDAVQTDLQVENEEQLQASQLKNILRD